MTLTGGPHSTRGALPFFIKTGYGKRVKKV